MDIDPQVKEHPWLIAIIAAIVAGLGQLLASKEVLTARIVIGRALSSAALGVASSVVFIWYPEADPAAMLGLACLFASLGTSGLERVLQKVLGRK